MDPLGAILMVVSNHCADSYCALFSIVSLIFFLFRNVLYSHADALPSPHQG